MNEDERQVTQKRQYQLTWTARGDRSPGRAECETADEARRCFHALKVMEDAGLATNVNVTAKWLNVYGDNVGTIATWVTAP